ncbi:MAG: signal peptidase I [Clostridium sartagoforme]|nr:signal peptidase I [Clostridium sartagoforme]
MNFKRISREVKGIIITIISSVVLVSIINTKVFAMAKVQQKSMENTLFNDEKLFVDKLSYNFEKPKRGDIIIFLKDEEKGSFLEEGYSSLKEVVSLKHITDNRTRYIKRVIGIEGDEINIYSGDVYVNGEKIDEPYEKGETYIRDIDFPIVIGENELFVLGDNREFSMDSRDFGLININQIEGRAIFRMLPLERLGALK